MPELIVVCSAHRERGCCNAGELLRILQELAPDVVFTEPTPADLASPQSLEGWALRAYTANQQCRVVPVDEHEIPLESAARLKEATERVFDYVEQRSDDYAALKDLLDHESFFCGFKYLNSRQFAALSARLENIEDEVASQSPDERVRRTLEEWRSLHQGREQRMVDAVYRYSREQGFDRGVLLVGAAHKHGVLRKAALAAAANTVRITWTALEDQAEPPPPGTGI